LAHQLINKKYIYILYLFLLFFNSNFDIIELVIKLSLEKLKAECEKCEKCPLCGGRTNVVFGGGDENADILLIGEAPGANEDLQGKPFIGRSGKLLDSMLNTAGLSRENNIYITNMVKCRPPENRDPKPAETAVCREWLEKQMEIIQPKIVVCIGRIAAQKIIDKDFRVTQQHGEFVEKNGVFYTATYHPAAILRNINNKPYAIEDWRKIKEKAMQ